MRPDADRLPSFGTAARALRVAGSVVGAAVVAGHAALLLERLRDATIGEPAVAARWALSALIVAAAATAHRRLEPVARRRAGGVLVLAALALHFGGPAAPSGSEPLATLLATLPVGLVAAAAWTVASSVRPHTAPARPSGPRPPRLAVSLGRLHAKAVARALPRPPPVA